MHKLKASAKSRNPHTSVFCETKSTVSMTDRRRINGPSGGTAPPVFASSLSSKSSSRAKRTREPDELRKICGSCPIYNVP